MGKVVTSLAEGCRVCSSQRLHRFILCTRRSWGNAHEGAEYGYQMDLPLSVAGCGRL